VDFAGTVAMCDRGVWRSRGIVAVHGDQAWPEPAAGELLVLGHIHPALGIVDPAGVRQRVPVFLHAPGQLVVLPAFSPFAAGLDVARRFPSELRPLAGLLQAVAATGRRAVSLGGLARLLEDAAATGRGATAQDFQRLRYQKH
jgi:metallophosphoesterase superfamily enzyme